MNGEQKDNITLLEEKIKKQLTGLRRYYSIHYGWYDDGFKKEVDSTLKLIEDAEEGKVRESWLAEALSYKINGDKSLNEDENMKSGSNSSIKPPFRRSKPTRDRRVTGMRRALCSSGAVVHSVSLSALTRQGQILRRLSG